MNDPRATLVSLVVTVHGAIYERYASAFIRDAAEHFLPGQCQIVVLDGIEGSSPCGERWSDVSSNRPRDLLNNLHRIDGDYIFQADVDMRIVRTVGEEILADGLVVTMHPGFPEPGDTSKYPYERRPESRAYVPFGEGYSYHPGAFVGGRRAEFLELCEYTAANIERDVAEGVRAAWYEESYLNRYLIDHPPAKILDWRYCGWGIQAEERGAIICHLNKTPEEFAGRG